MQREPQNFFTPHQFLDGEPIPDGYLDQVSEMINIVCDAEEHLALWELEDYASRHA